VDTEGKGRRKSQKKLMSVKGGRFGKYQQKLSLRQLPMFPHSSAFSPSGLVLTWGSVRGHINNEQRKSFLAVSDCIERAVNAYLCDWEDGSRPFFWRWSAEYHNQIRD
jgi:hypothetical protein